MGVHQNLTGAERAARYRAAKRAQGLRPIQIWVPDLRRPEVIVEIQRSVALINARREEAKYNDWLSQNYDELMAGEPDYDWGGKEPK